MADLVLPRGKWKVLQADDKDYKRGLLVKLLEDGGYKMAYWYNKPNKPMPVEIIVDGESITKDGKVVEMKFHPKDYYDKQEESTMKLEELVGKPITEAQFDEAAGKKDACYHKVKARYDVWPSAYASGALVKCRKVGAKNWGNKSKKEGLDDLKALPKDLKKSIKKNREESVNEAGMEMNKLKDAIKMFQKKIEKQGRVTNARDEEHLSNLIKLYVKMGGKGIKESDLGLTYKKGKTVKVKHKTSGKSLIIIDKPNVRKEYEKIGFFAEGSCGYGIDGKVGSQPAGPHLIKKKKKKVNEDVQDLKKVVKELENASKMHLAQSKRIQSHLDDMNVDERVIKVDKNPHKGVRNTPKGKTFNPLLLKGEDKIKALVWSGSYPKGKGSYELKGNKLNVNGINPRDKGFYIAHFTKNTKIKRANLYYDGVHWQDKNKKF